jgi:exodeoxyribonuclease-1
LVLNTFYWHDYETTGTDPARDRPLQFAGVRTDAQFNIIAAPLVLYCRPAEDVVPHPQACLVTGITPQTARREGVIEAEFIARIHAELAHPGTCGVGYNSIRFDDEFTRYTLYRNFYDPYAREWQNGCSRWDIIDMLRLTRALRPEGIEWPCYDDGRPSMRLEDLTRANGIDHGHAHDALADVYATIAIARLVRERQPKLFDYVLQHRGKRAVQAQLDVAHMKPVLHISSKYPAEWGNAALVAPLATHPTNRNSTLVWDLRIDPTPLFELDPATLRTLLFTRREEWPADAPPLGLKQVLANRCPIIAPAKMLTAAEAERLQIDGALCRRHLRMLHDATGVAAKVADIFAQPGAAGADDPDQMLYSGGFFSDHDRALMAQVRQSEPEALAGLRLPFQDPRLEEMLLRYKARNFAYTLTAEEAAHWEEYRRRKLLQGDGGCYSLPQLFNEMNTMLQSGSLSERERHILEELVLYAESIYPGDF